MKYLLITAVGVLLVYLAYRTYRFVNLADGLDKKIENGAIILDVRTAGEYATGHIEGSINISWITPWGPLTPVHMIQMERSGASIITLIMAL